MALELVVKKGSTDVIVYPKWLKKEDGTPGTDIAHDSSGISIVYIREGFDDVAITPAAGSDPDVADDAHSDGQLLHVAEGVTRLDLPDAVCATGVTNVKIVGSTTAHIMEDIHITLIDGDVGAEGATQTSVDDIQSDVTLILEDTAEMQSDLADGGRLDLILDAIQERTDNLPDDPADASDIDDAFTTVSSILSTLDGKIDVIDGIVDTILVDTNELQTDWVNGGRLDLLIDAIKGKTDSLAFTVAGKVNANMQYVAGVQLQGAGTSGDKWRPV